MTGVREPALNAVTVREVLADAYRDAALAGADMVQAVAILESLRVPLADGADVFSAWKVTGDAIGRGGPGPLRDVLVALRGRIHDRLVAAHLDYVRTRPDDGQARARAWLELLARALAELRLEVVTAISLVPPPDSVAVLADLVAAHRRDLDREDYGLAYPLFAAVAAHPLTLPSVRMGVTARCAEIQVYRLANPEAGRALLDRLSSASAGSPDAALIENAWGSYWLARGDVATARDHLLRAVDLDKSLAHPYRNLGDSYLREEDPHAALTWYEASLAACPGSMEPYQSMLSFNTRPERAGQFRSAAPGLVEMAAALEPFSIVSVYVSAADTYYQAAMASHGDDSDLATAESWLRRAVEIAPERPDVQIVRASLVAKRDGIDAALAILEAAADAEPGRFDLTTAAAFLCGVYNRDEEGARWLRRAMESDVRLAPEPVIRLWLSEACRRAGDLAAAEAELTKSLLLAPAALDAVTGMRQILVDYLRRDGRSGAQAALDRIAAAGPRDTVAWLRNGTGDLEFAELNYREAAAAYKSAADLAPDVAGFRYNLIGALVELGEFDAARKAIGEALAADRNMLRCRAEEALVANAEANQRFGKDEYAEAIVLYQEAARLSPTDFVVLTNLANAWDLLADPERRKEAVDGSYEALRSARSLAPKDTVVATRLSGATAVRNAAAEFGELAYDPLPSPYAVRLVVSTDLLPVVTDDHGELTAEIATAVAQLRRQLWDDLGVTLPGVNVTDDDTLPTGMTSIELDGVQFTRTAAPAGFRFCAASGEQLDAAGIDAGLRQPATLLGGATGAWLAEAAWKPAEAAGLTLATQIEPSLNTLIVVIRANAHHLIGLEPVAKALGADAIAAAPRQLPEFIQALRAHVADGLSVKDVGALWQRYLAAWQGGSTPTDAAEALRADPRAAVAIEDWCRTRAVVAVDPRVEAWLSGRRRELSGGPALYFASEDLEVLPRMFGDLSIRLLNGAVLATRDPTLRPLIARAFREVGLVASVVAAAEVPEGIELAALPIADDHADDHADDQERHG